MLAIGPRAASYCRDSHSLFIHEQFTADCHDMNVRDFVELQEVTCDRECAGLVRLAVVASVLYFPSWNLRSLGAPIDSHKAPCPQMGIISIHIGNCKATVHGGNPPPSSTGSKS